MSKRRHERDAETPKVQGILHCGSLPTGSRGERACKPERREWIISGNSRRIFAEAKIGMIAGEGAANLSAMNWTSTEVPMWQVDCVEFHRVGRPFEVREVKTGDHESFIEAFAAHNGLETVREGSTVRFFSRPSDGKGVPELAPESFAA